ncbi:MAG: spore germination protein GerW family protein [Dehalococcoidia bacterium]|nr:spore germination protein GerW family protein [Dehalococcoidia bacterium]
MFDDVLRAIENLARSFQERLSVRTVYGEPISANGITVVPAARVSFGFGGGGGGGAGTEPAEGPGGEATARGGSGGGGGGGGGGLVRPLGYIEISDAGSRWVSLEKPRAEQMLRGLATLAALAPIGRRRGLLLRGVLLVIAQLLITQLVTTRVPAIPDRFEM